MTIETKDEAIDDDDLTNNDDDDKPYDPFDEEVNTMV